MIPKVLVLKADGTNRDEEMAYAFELAGGNSKIIHINELRSKKDMMDDFQILALPGGFAYGDDVASGKILAVELTSFFEENLRKFIDRKDTGIIGVCNGFQVLVRTGLLPFRKVGEMNATLLNNDSGHFECRWVRLKTEKESHCQFLKGLEDQMILYPVAHGEGKFFANQKTIDIVEQYNLVAFRYVDENGKPTQNYPDSPNGSLNAIAGITDTTGRILGLMPHPECFVRTEHHPNWRRQKIQPQGLPIFKNMVKFVRSA